MAQQAGFNALITVNGTPYGGATWSVDDGCVDVETTNTLGITGGPFGVAASNFETRIGGAAGATVTISQATFDNTANPFQAPFGLATQTYCRLVIFPDGAAGVSWVFPSVLILECNYSGTAREGQPLEFSGRSDGLYTEPAV